MTLMEFSSVRPQRTPRTVGKSYQSIVVMVGITAVMLCGICARLGYLQLVEGDRNRQLAESNRVRLLPKQPGRGNIFDRNGKILATSRLSHAVFLWPLAQTEKEWPTTVRHLSKILSIPESEIFARLKKVGYKSPMPVRIARSIGRDQATALEEYSSSLRGVQVEVEAVRTYPNGEVAAHVLGYTGEVDEAELEKLKDKGYRLSDIVGQLGVERGLEDILRGEWGGQQVEVDSLGQILRVIGEKPAQVGKDVHLTLDLELQKAAENALGNVQGAIVAMDPNNGAILAMVSRPAYDPNIFSSRISEETWKQLQGWDHPFVNRSLQSFPPASTFKIITTTAGIESGKFDPYTYLQTYPYVQAGGILFWDWNRAGFGVLGFPGALAWSSDTFFYQVGMEIGGETLIEWTRKYGFGQKTGIELGAEESPGLVADEAWKLKEIGEGWYTGDTINMSIGQGYLLASPLQVAMMFAVPANGGYKVKPHLLKDREDAKNWRESLRMNPETIYILQEGLQRVVYGGTGTVLNVSTIPPVAGKSGTAEDPPRESHTWFGAYGPVDKPEIVVVAFGENSGGHGGDFAGPIVLEVMEAYFNNKKVARATSE